VEQAHRAHIALKELQLPYEEVIIDLDKPREEWYLKVNPVRRLLPDLPIVHELTTF
jgi:glutathione S-transferase